MFIDLNLTQNAHEHPNQYWEEILKKYSEGYWRNTPKNWRNTMRDNGVQEEVEMEYCRRVGVPLKTDTSFVLPSCSQGGGRDEDGRGVLCPIAIFEVPAQYPLSDTFRFRTTELSQPYNGQRVLATCLSCLDNLIQSGKGNWAKNGFSKNI